jgi:hypothetical protein
MKNIKMHGPTMDGLAEVNREVPECDVQAYKAAGYTEGFKTGLMTNLEYGEAKDKAAKKDTKAKDK